MNFVDKTRARWNSYRHPNMSTATEDKRTSEQMWRDRAVTTMAILGGIFALWSISPMGRSGPPASPLVGNSSIAASTLAQNFAVEFVSTYVGASQADLKTIQRYITYPKLDMPTVRTTITDARPVLANEVSRAAEGVSLWNVVVSVTDPNATTASTKSPTATARAFYAVPISVVASSPRAMTLPRRIGAPPIGVDVDLGYGYTVNSGPLREVVESFLRAYLTDPEQVNRYVLTDSQITAPTPTPYNTVEVSKVTADGEDFTANEGATMRVLATVSASTLSYTKTTLAYPLSLSVAGGHWQVASIDQIPVLGSGVDDTARAEASTPPSTSATPSIPPATRSDSAGN